jgi:hypothetical protein
MTDVAPWSFSKIKSFQQCPKQFYYEKILKQYPTKVSQAMLYGTHFHTACENYIGKGEPLPEKYSYMQDALDSLNAIEGTKIAERPACSCTSQVAVHLYLCSSRMPYESVCRTA